MTISEKKLSYYLHVAEDTCSGECKKIITQLVDEVRKINAEADWLAENAGECPYVSGGSTFCWRHCPLWIGPRDRSGHCEQPDMREAARRACHD